jgi:hypothetical protein
MGMWMIVLSLFPSEFGAVLIGIIMRVFGIALFVAGCACGIIAKLCSIIPQFKKQGRNSDSTKDE